MFMSKAAVSETDRKVAKTTTSLRADNISYYWLLSAEDELRGLTVWGQKLLFSLVLRH